MCLPVMAVRSAGRETAAPAAAAGEESGRKGKADLAGPARAPEAAGIAVEDLTSAAAAVAVVVVVVVEGALVDVPGLEGLGFLRSGPMWFQ